MSLVEIDIDVLPVTNDLCKLGSLKRFIFALCLELMLGRIDRRSSFIKEWNKQRCWKGRLDSEKNKINFGNEINREENLCIEIVRMEVLIQRGRNWSNTMIREPVAWISKVQRWIWYLFISVDRSKTQQ